MPTSFKDFVAMKAHTEFSGILTLDLPNDKDNKRHRLYELFNETTGDLVIEKLDKLDTVWIVKCFDFHNKSDANGAVKDFLEQCIRKLEIKYINVCLSLSLSYLDSKPIDRVDLNGKPPIDYSLIQHNIQLLENLFEPTCPVSLRWDHFFKEWSEEFLF